jgi:hypothetical protein
MRTRFGFALILALALATTPVAGQTSLPATRSDDGYHFRSFQDGRHDGRYAEWWYFNVVDVEQQFEAAFAYSIVDPSNRSGLALSSLLAVVYTPAGHIQQLVSASPDAFQASEQQADVSIDAGDTGAGRVEVIDDLTYRIRGRVTGEHTVEWNLLYAGEGEPFVGLDRRQVGRREWERMSWFVAMPGASVSGQVTIDGRRYAVTGVRGYHDHNWGEWQPFGVRWNWAQYHERGLHIALGDFMTAPEGVVGLDLGDERTVFAHGQYRLTHTAWEEDPANGRRFPTTTWLSAESEMVRLVVRLRSLQTVAILPPFQIPIVSEPLLYEQTALYSGRVWRRERGGDWRLVRVFSGVGLKEYTTTTTRVP